MAGTVAEHPPGDDKVAVLLGGRECRVELREARAATALWREHVAQRRDRLDADGVAKAPHASCAHPLDGHLSPASTRSAPAIRPATAEAATVSGLARKIEARSLPIRPGKFSVDVETHTSPSASTPAPPKQAPHVAPVTRTPASASTSSSPSEAAWRQVS